MFHTVILSYQVQHKNASEGKNEIFFFILELLQAPAIGHQYLE